MTFPKSVAIPLTSEVHLGGRHLGVHGILSKGTLGFYVTSYIDALTPKEHLAPGICSYKQDS